LNELISTKFVSAVIALSIVVVFMHEQSTERAAERRSAALTGLAGSIRSGAALAHSIWVADGGSAAAVALGDGRTVEIDLQTGYPKANTDGIRVVLPSIDGFSGSNAPGKYVFTIAGTPPAKCNVTYATGSSDGDPPRVTVKNNANGGDCG